MRRLFPFHRIRADLFSSLLIGLLFGCAQVPLTHYYTFNPDSVATSSVSTAPVSAVLAIGTIEADVPYQQDRIAFRTSPYEVGFYEYQKWLRPLPELVQTQMLRQAKASGLFARVHGQAFQVGADYILIGTLTMFDRWDSVTPSEVRVQMTYQLLDASGDQILWMDTIASTTPVSELQNPVTTVQSFETALHINIQRALETVHDVVSQHP